MIFEQLNEEERRILLRIPAVVAIFAAISNDGNVSANEKSESVKLSHLRTHTSPPILQEYYQEVDKDFEKNFDEIMGNLPTEWKDKEAFLEEKIVKLNQVLTKLDKRYRAELVNSLKSFAKHVFRTNSSFLKYFILPIFMNKIESDGFNLHIDS